MQAVSMGRYDESVVETGKKDKPSIVFILRDGGPNPTLLFFFSLMLPPWFAGGRGRK